MIPLPVRVGIPYNDICRFISQAWFERGVQALRTGGSDQSTPWLAAKAQGWTMLHSVEGAPFALVFTLARRSRQRICS